MQVDLDQAEGQAFLDALLDSEPNRLGAGFRAASTGARAARPCFRWSFCVACRSGETCVRDAQGLWTEGPSLDWDRLPERVEAAIAERIERLPRQEQELLTVASVEGEEFHAEVAAHALKMDDEEVSAALSGSLSREHRLVRASSLQRAGRAAVLSVSLPALSVPALPVPTAGSLAARPLARRGGQRPGGAGRRAVRRPRLAEHRGGSGRQRC